MAEVKSLQLQRQREGVKSKRRRNFSIPARGVGGVDAAREREREGIIMNEGGN
jgi:hypothetical protein